MQIQPSIQHLKIRGRKFLYWIFFLAEEFVRVSSVKLKQNAEHRSHDLLRDVPQGRIIRWLLCFPSLFLNCLKCKSHLYIITILSHSRKALSGLPTSKYWALEMVVWDYQLPKCPPPIQVSEFIGLLTSLYKCNYTFILIYTWFKVYQLYY